MATNTGIRTILSQVSAVGKFGTIDGTARRCAAQQLILLR